jgi:hypothetical protein
LLEVEELVQEVGELVDIEQQVDLQLHHKYILLLLELVVLVKFLALVKLQTVVMLFLAQ